MASAPELLSGRELKQHLDPRKGRGRPDLWKAPDAAIARLRLQGFTIKEIVERVSLRSRATIRVRLQKMGFPDRQCRFRHGKPVTGRAILDLCEDFGLTKRDLVKILNREKSRQHINDENGGQLPTWLAESIYRQSIAQKVDAPLGIEVADALLWLRAKWIKEFCVVEGRRGGEVREFLKSEIRDLPGLKGQLKKPVAELRREHPIEDIVTWICQRARDEVANSSRNKSSGQGFRTLMFIVPTLEMLIANKPDFLTEPRSTDEVVDELLSVEYDATPFRMRCAAGGELTPLDARLLGRTIRQQGRTDKNPLALVASQKSQGGRPAKKRELFLRAAELYQQLNSWGLVAKKLVPAEYDQDPRGTSDRLRLGAKHVKQVLLQTSSEKT